MSSENVIYRYDGSYDGFLCCVFESFYKKEMPLEIESEENAQTSLYPVRHIETDVKKAERVFLSFSSKISREAEQLLELAFYTCMPHRELAMLRFLQLGYRYGACVCDMHADPAVSALQDAVKHLLGESHQLKGFIRFSVYDGVLVAEMEPKNFVLPLLQDHFCERYRNETFFIQDKTHGCALISQNGKGRIIEAKLLRLPDADEEEQKYRDLWKLFHHTIAIEARKSARRQMSHMQKRYWNHLTEMQPTWPHEGMEKRLLKKRFTLTDQNR